MTRTTGVGVAAPPPHSFVSAQAVPPTSTRPSFESEKTYRPDAVSSDDPGVVGSSSPTKSELPTVLKSEACTLNIRKLNIKFAAVCLALFLEGWNLGATGPLIPAIQKHYDVGL